jgi:hypothetical protein
MPRRKPSAGKSARTDITLQYPKHWLNPEDVLDFIETRQFTRRWQRLGLNDEEQLCTLQLLIAAAPKDGSVVKGTNGIRKIRYSPPGWNIGKSGALRVLYVYFEEFGFVLLLLVYDKSEIDDISDAVKTELNRLTAQAEVELRRRWEPKTK